MKYKVDSWIFEKNPEVCFGVIIGKNLMNSKTTEKDSDILSIAENSIKERINLKELREYPQINVYREALRNVYINPNKFINSVEAMSKRVIKSGSLPRINALVDLCNSVALNEIISLGAHDLRDIDDNLFVRLSKENDIFRPFGSIEFEDVNPGELVFTCGNKIQTRQWLWRQSELGKITESSSDIFFQLVGFKGKYYSNFLKAMETLENLIKDRFKGESISFKIDIDNNEIEFK